MQLPRGYIAMLPLVIFKSDRFIELMTAELERKKLGPFAVEDAA